jgi:hypothetical protein
MDDTKINELLNAYQQRLSDLERFQIVNHTDVPDEPLDPKDVPVLAFGLISEMKSAVSSWQMKREVEFEGKTFRKYSATMTNADGDSKLIFLEVQLIYDKPEDVRPIGVSMTETKPDDNGALHERHFSAKYYSESTAELQYVEYPYRQKEHGKPAINTKSIVLAARQMIQQLAKVSVN